jgi:hypothetical protein
LLGSSFLSELFVIDGYIPGKRELFPSQFMRPEVLNALKLHELSNRKFCEVQLNNLNQKASRIFACLFLEKKVAIPHWDLSTFRSSLSFSRPGHLMVYVIFFLMESGKFDKLFNFFGRAEKPRRSGRG